MYTTDAPVLLKDETTGRTHLAQPFIPPELQPAITDDQVLLLDQINGQQFQEIFMSSEFGPSTPSDQLLLAVSAARVGVHVIKQTPQG